MPQSHPLLAAHTSADTSDSIPPPAPALPSRRRRWTEVSPTKSDEPSPPPRKRPPRGSYADDHDIPDPITPSETIQPAIVDSYLHKVCVEKSEDPSDAGWGLLRLSPSPATPPSANALGGKTPQPYPHHHRSCSSSSTPMDRYTP